MWLTIFVIVVFSLYISYLFDRGRYFYLHSFFLVPLYPIIFFVDHNGHYLTGGDDVDSVHYVAKLLPLYLNIFYLLLRFRPRILKKLSFTIVVVNVFLLYNVALSIVYAIYHSSTLPLFYISYSVPIFAIYFNSRNFAEEVAQIRRSVATDKKLLDLYFIAFLFVYAASIYYSIRASVTTSLLDSRGVGSIFASTSALVYCLMYAPLLVAINRKKWPYAATIAISVTSLSKTALLILPAFLILLYRRFRNNVLKYAAYYTIVALILIALLPMLASTDLAAEWAVKFSLDTGQSFLEKFYMTRLQLYEDALHVIRDYPFGIGVGNFELYSHDNYRDPHHFILAILSESGLIVGTLFVLVVFGAFLKALAQIANGVYEFNHFSIISVFLVYVFSGGVLQTVGTSEFSTIYYTPFYGVVIFQLLNLAGTSAIGINARSTRLTRSPEQLETIKMGGS
jgi:hypothetical protein